MMSKDDNVHRFVVDGSRVIDTESEWGGFEVTASGSGDDESRAISVAEALNYAADRLEALAQPVVGVERAEAGARGLARFYHRDADPDAGSPPLWFAYLGEANAVLEAASPSPVVGELSEPTKRMEKILGAPFVRRDAPVVGDREAIARIIDPVVMSDDPDVRLGKREPLRQQLRDELLAKADAILSLSTPVVGGGDRALRRVLEALTPHSETKAAYMGEFSWTDWRDDENGISNGHQMTVPWTTIKEIMAAIRERAGVEKLDESDAMAVLEESNPHTMDRAGMAQEVGDA